MRTGVVVLFVAMAAGCQGADEISGTQVKMDFTRASFYDAPFPSDDLVHDDGTIGLSKFPNPKAVELVGQGLNLLGKEARGFSLTGGVFFQLSGGLGKLNDESIFLTPCDQQVIERTPVQLAFHEDGGPFGSPNLLSLLVLQGVPLRPGTQYCAVVMRDALDVKGNRLGVSKPLLQLTRGERPDGITDLAFRRYRRALLNLGAAGLKTWEIAGLAVFTTDDPTAAFTKVKQAILARPHPKADPFVLTDTFDDYCVYASAVKMPVYQGGEPPYSKIGGRWVFDRDGNPDLQVELLSSLFVTIPRRPMPPGGYPTAVFVRAGGGGDRPLVDRGVQPATGSPATIPGTGPALEFARAGFAGVSVDGPLGGLRNVTKGDEQFLVYNFFNAGALRDNIRESAVELVLLAHLVDDFHLDTSGCPGASPAATLDSSKLALMGHSTGASIAPLAIANEPRYRAGILSGAGASFIENVIYKEKPMAVLPLAEVLIGYSSENRKLLAEDPVLTLVQWAAEPADPQVYNRRIITAPRGTEPRRHILMMQGIVDHYILPRIANPMSVSLGLDLAGDELDATELTGLPDQTPLSQLLPWSGRANIPLPAAGNLYGGSVTAVVVQHPEDGIEDGHEVVFQTEAPKREYRCFLESFAKGIPRVPAPGLGLGCE